MPMTYTTMPTICPYSMEHVEVTPVTPQVSTVGDKLSAPKLFEASPNAEVEQIVEITVTNNQEEKPKMLTPSTDDVTQVCLLPLYLQVDVWLHVQRYNMSKII